jgi:acetyltransferase
MIALMDSLQDRGSKVLEGDVLASNRNMLDFVARLGFDTRSHPDQAQVKRVGRKLRQQESPAHETLAE